MKNKAKILGSSAAAIVLSASLIAGSTFALFSSESKIDIAVTSGKVEVTASIDKTSLTAYTLDQNTDTKEKADGESGSAVFPITLGTATLGTADGDPDLSIENFVPGNSVEFDIIVENNSSIAVKYQFGTSFEGDRSLFGGLDVQLQEDGEPLELIGNDLLYTRLSHWRSLAPAAADPITLHVIIDFPIEFDDNTAQGKACSFVFTVSAVQANAATAEPVPVTADSENVALSTETELKALGDLVEEGESFEGKTVELSGNVTVTDDWEPIGTNAHPFEGNFNGNGHTINFNGTCDISTLEDDKTFGRTWGLFGIVNDPDKAGIEIKDVRTEGKVTFTGELTNGINLGIGGIFGTSRFHGVNQKIDIQRCTNSLDIDLSQLTIGSDTTALSITIGGISSSGGGSMGTVSDCLNEGNIILPAALDDLDAGIGGMIAVGGILGIGETSRTGVATLKNVLNVGTMPTFVSPSYTMMSLIGGVYGYHSLASSKLAEIGGSWFSLNAPVVGLGQEGPYQGNVLTAETILNQETFVAAGFDFDTVWKMGEKYPVLQ